mmetsp:Transcript_63046/g.150397  ORF Transcript_63046/g.150397 Transcript_63046/m.150397 type:complete len:218 (+) Transcript_63046:485-1138(+)
MSSSRGKGFLEDLLENLRRLPPRDGRLPVDDEERHPVDAAGELLLLDLDFLFEHVRVQHRFRFLAIEASLLGSGQQNLSVAQILLLSEVVGEHLLHELILHNRAALGHGPRGEAVRVERVARVAAQRVLQPDVGEDLGEAGEHLLDAFGAKLLVVHCQFVLTLLGGGSVELVGAPVHGELHLGELLHGFLHVTFPHETPGSDGVGHDVDDDLFSSHP